MTMLENHPSTALSDLVRRDRVHGSVYTSPEIFDAEMERIFSEGWVYVAHESEVGEPGDYVTRRMGRQPVIVSRGDDGLVHVLSNRCAHRGNRICNAEAGNSSSFKCPYHGWMYGNDGHLVAIPMKQAYGERHDAIRSELGLAACARVDAYGGFVFASFATEGKTLLQHLGLATTAIDRLNNLSHRSYFAQWWRDESSPAVQLEDGDGKQC